MKGYFLAFFGLVFWFCAGCSGAAFFGRPTELSKFFTLSTVSGEYTLVFPTLRTGCIFIILIRLFTVSKEVIPAFSAISFTVSSFITPISVKLAQKLRFVNYFLLEKKVKKSDRFRLNMLDNLTDIGYILA